MANSPVLNPVSIRRVYTAVIARLIFIDPQRIRIADAFSLNYRFYCSPSHVIQNYINNMPWFVLNYTYILYVYKIKNKSFIFVIVYFI